MFVNLDGDVVRGTIEFSSYPECLVLDGVVEPSESMPQQDEQEGYVLALVSKQTESGVQKAVEIQRWNGDPAAGRESKDWLHFDGGRESAEQEGFSMYGTGLRSATSPTELSVNEIAASLRLRRLQLDSSSGSGSETDMKRNEEEDRFASRFAQATAGLLFYHHDRVYWIVRSALITRLEKQLVSALQHSSGVELTIEVPAVQRILSSIRGQEASNELDYLALTYIRQKASLLLFGQLVVQTSKGIIAYERDKRNAEEALITGNIDPRTILLLLSLIHI